MNEIDAFTRWRRMREEGLAVPHGWLTLTSYQWLPAEPGAVDMLPGRWSADADGARLEVGAEEGITNTDGDPVDGILTRCVGEDESIHWVRHGDTLVELGMRGGRYMIRTRTKEHPFRTSFTGVPVFDYSPAWIVSGTYQPHEAPRVATIDTYRPDTRLEAAFDGEVLLDIAGRTVSLAARDDGNGTLSVAFFDSTNGADTAAWRHVSFPAPAPGPDAAVRVDFNRTLNYPMAFSEFAVCPAPLAGNLIPVPVTAGEKKPI
ncbi:DUF1684 domain-containing protein [Paeniglutamicibacter cryotolerans]|uniref:DUF1684 domain-containing protein n=1 Tax=Paeniglutamicibacter cryotolerans TaxID=670079 RepID=A0A839QPW0_9MICC|nr:DUF1684 domain-containing protein [Paeniglutamicibacter cryotolerans]MBB2995282.1 hypothetical protein [Paeniglutamicibacter cryotolerans]